LGNSWSNLWPYIQHTFEEKLKGLLRSKYKNLDIKLTILTRKQTIKPLQHISFYPRVINNTSIAFSDKENALLGKGLKYDLHSKKKY
jgi:hypothetical protein